MLTYLILDRLLTLKRQVYRQLPSSGKSEVLTGFVGQAFDIPLLGTCQAYKYPSTSLHPSPSRLHLTINLDIDIALFLIEPTIYIIAVQSKSILDPKTCSFYGYIQRTLMFRPLKIDDLHNPSFLAAIFALGHLASWILSGTG